MLGKQLREGGFQLKLLFSPKTLAATSLLHIDSISFYELMQMKSNFIRLACKSMSQGITWKQSEILIRTP